MNPGLHEHSARWSFTLHTVLDLEHSYGSRCALQGSIHFWLEHEAVTGQSVSLSHSGERLFLLSPCIIHSLFPPQMNPGLHEHSARWSFTLHTVLDLEHSYGSRCALQGSIHFWLEHEAVTGQSVSLSHSGFFRPASMRKTSCGRTRRRRDRLIRLES